MTENSRPLGLTALAHPLTVLCLAGWLVNDHVLKDRLHNAVTGKLSDLFAMVVFPLLVAALVERFTRRPLEWGVGFTAAFLLIIGSMAKELPRLATLIGRFGFAFFPMITRALFFLLIVLPLDLCLRLISLAFLGFVFLVLVFLTGLVVFLVLALTTAFGSRGFGFGLTML